MALAISLYSKGKGKDTSVYVGGHRVSLVCREDTSHYVLSAGGKLHYITPDDFVEVLPDVLVRAGYGQDDGRSVRVLIDAPKNMKILRESIVNKPA
jgi:hypothetical protein